MRKEYSVSEKSLFKCFYTLNEIYQEFVQFVFANVLSIKYNKIFLTPKTPNKSVAAYTTP